MESDYLHALELLREATCVIIPAYFPPLGDPRLPVQLLTETTLGCCRELADARRVCISVDGANPAVETARDLHAQMGTTFVSCAQNRGKLAAIEAGLREFCGDPDVAYLAIIDQDGDHFPNELLNFVRASSHVEAAARTDRVLVLGRRATRDHPLGFLRGEMEELADRVLLDALQYHSCASGVPLNLEFALHLDDFPDFHSGFKLVTKPLAQAFLDQGFPLEGLPDGAVFRHAVEAVLSVETVLAGGLLTSVARSTNNEQPISVFGLLDRSRLVADKILWPLKRLRVPTPFGAQWLDNHLARLRLMTLNPEGKKELLAIRRLVREGLGLLDDGRAIFGPPFY